MAHNRKLGFKSGSVAGQKMRGRLVTLSDTWNLCSTNCCDLSLIQHYDSCHSTRPLGELQFDFTVGHSSAYTTTIVSAVDARLCTAKVCVQTLALLNSFLLENKAMKLAILSSSCLSYYTVHNTTTDPYSALDCASLRSYSSFLGLMKKVRVSKSTSQMGILVPKRNP